MSFLSEKDKNIVLFGAGRNGMIILNILMDNGIRPAHFVDNNPSVKSIAYDGINGLAYFPIKNPEALQSENKENLKIIITPDNPFYTEIEAQLTRMGLSAYVFIFDIMRFFLSKYEHEFEPICMPERVSIDASTMCQLNCTLCGMRRINHGNIGNGYLSFSNFKGLIDSNPYIRTVELSNNGEIFLNPDLKNIIEYAFSKSVSLTANSGTNFNTVSDELLETLVKYQFSSLVIALDGTNQNTYSLYRRNGNYNRVIENIVKINDLKTKFNSDLPKLTWQYIIMEHNEEEVVSAKCLAKQLNMEINFKLTWDADYSPRNPAMLRKETGLQFLTRDEYLSSNPKSIDAYLPCTQLWDSPQINWDGRLLGCCVILTSDFGVNVFEKGLDKALNSDNFRYAKLMLQGKAPLLSNPEHIKSSCMNCGHLRKMFDSNFFIDREIIHQP